MFSSIEEAATVIYQSHIQPQPWDECQQRAMRAVINGARFLTYFAPPEKD